MGFMDKAKKMAEQAQTKLDEVQKQFNEGQSGSGEQKPPPVEYDQHGRPIAQEPPPAATTPPPHGDPVQGQSAPPPSVPGAAAPVPDPAAPKEEDRNREDYTPPKLSSGDPLAG